jgi:hypothetical protein
MRRPVLTALLPVLGFLALLCALAGWLHRGLPPDAALFKAVHVLGAGGDYADAAKWRPNPWLEAARWLGLGFFVLTAYKAFGLLLSRQLGQWRAQFARRDAVLVGDAAALAGLAGELAARRVRVLWLHPGTPPATRGVRAVRQPLTRRAARFYRLGRARVVVLGYEGDDAAALAAVRHLLPSRGPRLVLLAGSAASAAVLESAVGQEPVQVALAVGAGVRAAHAARPPFAEAVRAGHRRLHALVLGCGDAGEAIVADLLRSALVTTLDRPLVTVVDPRAAEIRASFATRFPELGESMELRWIEAPGREDARALPAEALLAAAGEDPFSVAYVALADDRRSLAAALALGALTAQAGAAPPLVYVRQREGLLVAAGLAAEGPGATVAFGTAAQVVDGLGLTDPDPDRAARALHEAYLAGGAAGGPAAVPWAALPEGLREANRRVLAHLPAKRASAAALLGEGTTLADALAVPEAAERLAMLEHDRWSAERRLAGWRHGPARDDARRLHPDLVPFAALSPRSQAFDHLVIRTLAGL